MSEHLLFAQLENAGLIKNGKPQAKALLGLSLDTIVRLSHESIDLAPMPAPGSADNILAHAATIGLSGGRGPCWELSCRARRADALAQFAGLYSERVYTQNFLSDWAAHEGAMYDSVEEARVRFCEDIVLLLRWRPLINAGLIVPVTPPTEYCPHCFALQFFAHGHQRRFVRARKNLSLRMRREVQFAILREFDGITLEARGPKALLEHGYCNVWLRRLPEALAKNRNIVSRLQKGRVALSTSAVIRARLDDMLAGAALESVSFEMAIAQLAGAQYLADRELQVELLGSIAGTDDLTRQNELVQRTLTAMVPFVADIRAADLVRLRRDEADAFELFRSDFGRIVRDWAASGKAMSPREARQIYLDVIKPRLAKVELRIRAAGQRLNRGMGWDVLSLGAMLSFGLYRGFQSSGLLEAARVLGVTAAARGVAAAVTNRRLAEREASTDSMYFLWKVRQRAKGRGKH